MKLRIKPIYGWGWAAPDGSPMEVPGEFDLDVKQDPVGVIRGRVLKPGHPLNNFWVVLSQRHIEKDGCYNFSAFEEEPPSTMADAAHVAGFVEAMPVQP